MGLKAGESAEVYGPIEVLSVQRERLDDIVFCDRWEVELQGIDNPECGREGFPELSGQGFIDFFCVGMGGDGSQMVTRIKFRRVELRALDSVKLSPSMRRVMRASL